MPKASSAHRSLSGDSGLGTGGNQPNVLKRNQACHQCRRRKLVRIMSNYLFPDTSLTLRKEMVFLSYAAELHVVETTPSDAKRPCSTCVRSHAHAVSHASPGTDLPPQPECTFDDVAEPSIAVAEAPKSKYERLENRISELEELLRQKEGLASSDAHSSQTPESILPHSRGSLAGTQHPTLLASSATTYPDSLDTGRGHTFPVSPGNGMTGPIGNTPIASRTDIVWSNWPPNLPRPELIRHLAEVFFTFHPHANRLFHGSSFMNSLCSMPPGHPKFPATPVLHAICAMGSLYTAAVTSPPLPDFSEIAPDEIFLEKERIKDNRVDSFAEQQAKLARGTSETYTALGKDLLQVLQANIILSWFYWSHSRWADVFLHSAQSLRLSVPLGLNMCPPFHSISKSERPISILSAARTVVEDEVRRNAFWLAYAVERQHGASNGWASSMDDHDITQLLPLQGAQFENGTLVTPENRQWAHSPDLILTHPHGQVDSFILYIKGTILLSWVKTFNLRFRARHYAGDAAVASQPSASDNVEPIDPRASPAFVQIERTVTQFRSTFPAHLKNPINSNVVDNHLYSACLMPHVATIILHEPHADVRMSGCISALKILTAARAILDLIFAVSATSFDISLLDSFCSFAWFLAGRVLVRFLKAALETNSIEQISTLQSELSFVRSGISKIGQRIPLAYRYARVLEDHITQQTGSLPEQNLPLPMVELSTFTAQSFHDTPSFSQTYSAHNSLLP